MKQSTHDLILEYEFVSSPDTEERYSHALELITELILKDIQDNPEIRYPSTTNPKEQ